MTRTEFMTKELVLVGGGHAHAAVLKRFGMAPVPGVRLTLISEGSVAPYSGMLPGLIAGHYDFNQAHLELRSLCHRAGAQFYRATVDGLDLANGWVRCLGRPPVRYDVLSINTGSTPRLTGVPGAAEHALPVKPVAAFLERWATIVDRVRAGTRDSSVFRLVVVGGGAGGVELLLSTRFRLLKELAVSGREARALECHLISQAPEVPANHSSGVRRRLMRLMNRGGIQLHLGRRAVEVVSGQVHCDDGSRVAFDALLWATDAAAPAWVGSSGLATDAAGFITVKSTLQSESHPNVFAAGDVASMIGQPRSKSGLYAVRQGLPLALNLRRHLLGAPLEAYHAQRKHLALISTGNRYAIASRGGWSWEGGWVWKLKDFIDRRWMEGYQRQPEMPRSETPDLWSHVNAVEGEGSRSRAVGATAAMMRCGGCGAKVGSDILRRVLGRLIIARHPDVVVGLEHPDDAAALQWSGEKWLVQSTDFFRAFINDPFLVGKIAAVHSLSDLHAKGAVPHSALALATLPHGAETMVEEQLFQLLSGAAEALRQENVALIGGHTGEGAELAIGFTVNGKGTPGQWLGKGGAKSGDALILTKALGTGVILAANMQGRARGRDVDAALASMLLSNRSAAECLARHGATACTDVTGFGLAGHLAEMFEGSDTAARLELDAVPALPGAVEMFRSGHASSLHVQNAKGRRWMERPEAWTRHESFPVLFDPQTSGGLLASVPPSKVSLCLDELRNAGFSEAACVGSVDARATGAPPIGLV
ncbi:MAG: selenide, water dikinase SelD [Verrucomicrobiales bacterium]|nr:selenide, water dikinase SelD [Verrucomicrobiales bacterium]